MAAPHFRRALSRLREHNLHVLISHACGVMASVLYLVTVILFVMAVAVVVSPRAVQYFGEDAVAARIAMGQSTVEATADPILVTNGGLVHEAVRARNVAHGPVVAGLSARFPVLRGDVSSLITLLSLALVVELARALLLYQRGLSTAAATTGVIASLQQELFDQKFALGSPAFRPETIERIAVLLEQRLPVLHEALRLRMDTILREPVKIALMLGLAVFCNPWLGLSFLLLAALVYMVAESLARRTHEHGHRLSEAASEELQRLRGVANKIRLIKGYAAEDYFRKQYEAHRVQYNTDVLRRLTYEARTAAVGQVALIVVAIVVLGLGAENILTGRFSIPQAVGAYAALFSLVVPAARLYRARLASTNAELAAADIFDFLHQPHEVQQLSGASFADPMKVALEIDNVSHRDPTGAWVLRNVSFAIPRGQRVALMSRDGAEPQALLSLMARFVDPTEGCLRLDGRDIRTVTLESLRSQTCLVLQSDLLFPDSVANNIGCGDPGFPLERILESAKTAHAHYFVQRLPHGYECQVGDEGFPLKPDEAFRIALARAILRDPAIVVLEEPDAAVDEVVGLVDDSLDRFLQNRTAIFLPRRLSTLRSCDFVLLFDGGKLVARGTHDELMASSELYHYLNFNLQERDKVEAA